MGDGVRSSDEPVDPAAGETDHEVDGAVDLVANARRRHGALGGIVAASMLGLDEALGRKPREEAPIVVAASDEPVDVDTDGIAVDVDDETTVVAPPQPRSAPRVRPTGRKRRR